MSRKSRILIVDDSAAWCELMIEACEQRNIFAEAVSTIEEALQKLSQSFYHVLILDLCFEGGNINNSEGILLLQELQKRGLAETLKVIMLSAYGTTSSMHEAFHEYQVYDFIDKSYFDAFLFLGEIQKLLKEELGFNPEIEIHWNPKSARELAVQQLKSGNEYMKNSLDLHSQLLPELEDLFCRLFHKAESILVRFLPPGFSGMQVLWIQPFYKDGGGGQPTILKFGDRTKIRTEDHNFRTYVQPFITGGYNTNILEVRHTPHLGGITYSLLQLPQEPLKDFGSFYPQATIEQVQYVLNRLFLHTCKVWYSGMGNIQPHDLTADYQRALGNVSEVIQEIAEGQLLHIQEQQRFRLPSLPSERTFTNPLVRILDRTYTYPTYTCITHGDLNQHNILLDTQGNTWLIDFHDTGRSHFLRDLTMLDSVIRYQLVLSEEATLAELLHMEETLLGIRNYSQLERLVTAFSTSNQALAKAYASIVHLRMLVSKITGPKISDDMSEYYIGLLYHALNTLRFSSLSLRQREHALLCASLLIDILE
ncbi:MAG TPA: response regulator [Ktedonobacteraceae bacterium]|nr:response regulator [Ktedonobacteraceae bacterium]